MNRVLVFLFFVAVTSPALASQPGQPLDCSDFVIDKPGFTCRHIRSCESDALFPCLVGGYAMPDSEGNVIGAEYIEFEPTLCGTDTYRLGRLRIKVSNGTGEQLVAYVDWRCCPDSAPCREQIFARSVAFDAIGGRLLVSFESACGGGDCAFPTQYWLGAFEGFTTLFDVLDSYVPTSNSFGFRVPQRPEGLRGVDRFDTYMGELTTPLDLSAARPFQCSYPETPPSAGDYLSFQASGTPAPGRALYYLTSVSYQGETRAGRKALEGPLTGRDASQLPACVTAKEAN